VECCTITDDNCTISLNKNGDNLYESATDVGNSYLLIFGGIKN